MTIVATCMAMIGLDQARLKVTGAAIPSIKMLMQPGRSDIIARRAAGPTSFALVTSSP
jgi:hypothetical protein